MIGINVFYAIKGNTNYKSYGEIEIKSIPKIGEKIGLTISKNDLIFEIKEVIYTVDPFGNTADIFVDEIANFTDYYSLINKPNF